MTNSVNTTATNTQTIDLGNAVAVINNPKPITQSVTVMSNLVSVLAIGYLAISNNLHGFVEINVKDARWKANLNLGIDTITALLSATSVGGLTWSCSKYMAKNKNVFSANGLPGRNADQAEQVIEVTKKPG